MIPKVQDQEQDTLTRIDDQEECRRSVEFVGICFGCLLIIAGMVMGYLLCDLLQEFNFSPLELFRSLSL